MLLTGTFARSVDEKQRVAIPKKLRDALAEPDLKVLYVAPGTDGSLAIYTEAAFARLGERLANSPPTQQDVRAFGRLFYAQAERVDLDGQGRIRIPPELAKLAALEKDAVLIGVQDHMELWNRERWDAYLADRAARYDQIAEAAFGGTAKQ
jgi:MraZ protein